MAPRFLNGCKRDVNLMKTDSAKTDANRKIHQETQTIVLSKGIILLQDNARRQMAKFAKFRRSNSEGKFSTSPQQTRLVARRFPCVRETKKSTELTPVHTKR